MLKVLTNFVATCYEFLVVCCCRFSASMSRIKTLLNRYSDHLDMELQQRAVEYSAIFKKDEAVR